MPLQEEGQEGQERGQGRQDRAGKQPVLTYWMDGRTLLLEPLDVLLYIFPFPSILCTDP